MVLLPRVCAKHQTRNAVPVALETPDFNMSTAVEIYHQYEVEHFWRRIKPLKREYQLDIEWFRYTSLTSEGPPG